MTGPLVSLVTPFYNSAPYLRECIESVLKQTHAEWEYVLLDNCSTDGSGDIARDYASQDRRIRFVAADVHVPQMPNYNRALRLISPSSAYCKVVQADDWIFPEYLERMVGVAEASPQVAVVGCYLLKGGVHIRCDGLRYAGAGPTLPYPATIVSGREACRLHLLERQSVFGTQTSVLYRSDLVRGRERFYSESSLMGDSEVCYELLRERDFGFAFQVLAYARVHEGSLTDEILDFNPYPLQELILLRKYGAHYLTPAEVDERWRTLGGQYFQFLGRRVLRGASAAFWNYHRRGWDAMGYRVSRGDLMRYAMRAAATMALNPKSTWEELAAYWGARRRQS